FDMLGLEPVLGRLFTAQDDTEGAAPVVLLSRVFWLARFRADPDDVGQTLDLHGLIRVVAELPDIPPYPSANDVWIPAASDPFRLFSVSDVAVNRASGYILHVYARLKDGVPLARAEAEMNVGAQRLAAEHPDIYGQDYAITLLPL